MAVNFEKLSIRRDTALTLNGCLNLSKKSTSWGLKTFINYSFQNINGGSRGQVVRFSGLVLQVCGQAGSWLPISAANRQTHPTRLRLDPPPQRRLQLLHPQWTNIPGGPRWLEIQRHRGLRLTSARMCPGDYCKETQPSSPLWNRRDTWVGITAPAGRGRPPGWRG